MSQQIGTLEALIAALNANTAAILGQASTTVSAKDTATDPEENGTTETAAQKKARLAKEAKEKAAAEAKAKKPKFTKQEATDAVVSVKDTLGVDAAKELLSDHGFKKVAELTEDKFDEIYLAAKKLLSEAAGGDDESNDDDDGI